MLLWKKPLNKADIYFSDLALCACTEGFFYNLFLASSRPDEVVFAVLGYFGSDTPEMVAQKLVNRLTETSATLLELDKHLEQLRILANLRKLKPFLERIMEAITKYIKPEDDFLYKKGEQLGKDCLLL